MEEARTNATKIREAEHAVYMKSKTELDETKVILHKTMDSILDRGEKLDNLVNKSSDLSMASQMFYRQARKQNQCCKMM